jgi:hypothetical protein
VAACQGSAKLTKSVFGKSTMTNGTELLPGIDRWSPAARRFRDLWLLFLSDMAGESEASEGEKAILALPCSQRSSNSMRPTSSRRPTKAIF